MPIPKREANAILSSLNAGLVPRVGLRHIAVGRLREIGALKQDLDQIKEGGATVRFVIGRFGSGKTFMLQLARSLALDNKFVVADADFSPERRLQGANGQGLALYREIMRNVSTQTRPDGNALPAIIERWISNVQASVSAQQKIPGGTTAFAEAVQAQIMATVSAMEELVHGFDFGSVVSAYYRGYVESNDELKSAALRWLRGEFNTKTEANEALGVRAIIDDDNYYDYLKVLARFAHDVGYAGLMVCLDEAVNLYKITHAISRSNNYEKILNIVNDTLQGRATYIGFIFGGTPEFLQDGRRGLFSYEALRSRLATSRFATEELRDFSSPVLDLPPLTPEEIYVMLQKVRDIHRDSLPNSRAVDNDAIIKYMEESLRRVGAKEFATPRDLVREFVTLLNLLTQYPDKTWQEILSGLPTPTITIPDESAPAEMDEDDPLARFSEFKVK